MPTPRPTPTKSISPRAAAAPRKRAPRRRAKAVSRRHWPWDVAEAVCLVAAALVAVLDALGRAAARLVGVGLWANLLPFAGVVLGLVLVLAAILLGWFTLRARLRPRAPWLPAVAAAIVACGALWLAFQPAFTHDLDSLRSLLGGRVEAERRNLAHQVFAAYRRTPTETWKRMLDRSATYEAAVQEAAHAFGVDPEVLMGVGAAESSFSPRDSGDGGRGLFQITAPPAEAQAAARKALGVEVVDVHQPRHNAFLAAATLRTYLDEMHGDLFLALLAYNVGPKNGGLSSIMGQYGARDFVTIQPYLQNLPRDYPIRVLSAALAYRLWRQEGQLPRYEDGDNATRIQGVGVPGLPAE